MTVVTRSTATAAISPPCGSERRAPCDDQQRPVETVENEKPATRPEDDVARIVRAVEWMGKSVTASIASLRATLESSLSRLTPHHPHAHQAGGAAPGTSSGQAQEETLMPRNGHDDSLTTVALHLDRLSGKLAEAIRDYQHAHPAVAFIDVIAALGHTLGLVTLASLHQAGAAEHATVRQMCLELLDVLSNEIDRRGSRS
jgi:hypothetical protein